MSIKSYIKKIIPNNLKAKLRYHLGVPSQHKSFDNLKSLGFDPKIILDIGAYQGNWALEMKQIFPDCNILMIEGQTSKEEVLKQVCLNNEGLDYRIALLGAAEKSVNFNIYDTASSVLDENNDTGATVEQRQLCSLDVLLKKTNFLKPDLIKLDTQGYELEILKGGETVLNNTEAVLMEVSMLDIYKDCPLVKDVLVFMDDRDFVLYDICSLMRRPLDGALYQSDFLFLKKTSRYRMSKKWN